MKAVFTLYNVDQESIDSVVEELENGGELYNLEVTP